MNYMKKFENFKSINENKPSLLDYLNDHYNMTRGLGEWYEEGANEVEEGEEPNTEAYVAQSIDSLEMGSEEIDDVTKDYNDKYVD